MKGAVIMNRFGLTDKGFARAQNQDSFTTVEKDGALLIVVCDGIGGHKAGDVASRLACQKMAEHFKENYEDNPEVWFLQALADVNRMVYDKARESEDYRGMGTTMVAALMRQDDVTVLNVGDSRCYYLEKGRNLVQVTNDHSLVNELIREGMDPTKAMALGHHVITRAIGITPQITPDIFHLTERFRYLLVCTDGLYNYVNEDDIIRTLASRTTIDSKCQRLIDLANLVGGYDNITAVIAER